LKTARVAGETFSARTIFKADLDWEGLPLPGIKAAKVLQIQGLGLDWGAAWSRKVLSTLGGEVQSPDEAWVMAHR
jgi:hypothetical protein